MVQARTISSEQRVDEGLRPITQRTANVGMPTQMQCTPFAAVAQRARERGQQLAVRAGDVVPACLISATLQSDALRSCFRPLMLLSYVRIARAQRAELAFEARVLLPFLTSSFPE